MIFPCMLGMRAVMLGVLIAASADVAARAVTQPIPLRADRLPVAVEAAALHRQFAALSKMKEVAIEYSPLGPVMTLAGRTGLIVPRSVRDFREGTITPGLLDVLGPVLLATGRERLVVMENRHDALSREVRVEQTIGGIPVVDGVVSVSIDERSGEILYLGAAFLPDRGLPRKPELTAERAWQALVQAMESSGEAVAGSLTQYESPRLAYYGAQSYVSNPRLVWAFRASYRCPTGRDDDETVWVDAMNGGVAGRRPNGMYSVSPGPCRFDERAEADCIEEPRPIVSNAASCPIQAAHKPEVARVGCTTSFKLSWPNIPGAYRYYVQRTPKALGWAFARTVTQGFSHQCTVEVDAANLVRMQVCDRCGECGPWSDTALMDPGAACKAAE